MINRLFNFISNIFAPEESIEQSKKKWTKLAQEDAKYFVLSDPDRQNEEKFRASGKEDFESLILKDEFLQDRLKKISVKTVLEIGCGVGRITEFIAGSFEKVYAVDISGEMIKKLKNRLQGISNIKAFETDGVSLPLEDDSVDFVFSYIVFQHMPSREVVGKNFEEVSRVLKKKGIFKVQVRGTKAPKKEWYYGIDCNYRDIEKLCAKTGFSVLRHEGEGSKYFWLILEKK